MRRPGIQSTVAATALALLGGALATAPAHAGSETAGIYANQFSGTFNSPVHVTSAPGAAQLVFVVEQRGVVRVVRDGTKLRRPFLDIRRRVTSGGEQGLLSIAFHPGYKRNGKLYAYFTNRRCSASGGCDIEVAEFKRKRGSNVRANERSYRRVIRIRHRQAPNHNGGTAMFGPDRKLWLATGDGGGANDTFDNARKKGNLLGKLLRIDPRRARDSKRGYRIPPDNPFVGAPGRDEIWSIGLRNPFRFSFDAGSDLMGIADVGQDEREEVNILTLGEAKGANFGWPQYEGNQEVDPARPGPGPLRLPVHEYSHSDPEVAAVTGGVFLRDPRFAGVPDVPQGLYLFGDIGFDRLRRIAPDGGDLQTLPNAALSGPAGFGTDQQDRIYVAALLEDRVYRLDPAP